MGKRPKQTPLQRRRHMTKSTWKDVQHPVIRKPRAETRRCHYTPVGMARAAEDAEQWSARSLVGTQNGTATPEHGAAASYKTKHTLTVWSSSCALWDLKELKHVHTKTCTWMFTALFIIPQTWKQPRCPSTGEWIVWYRQTLENTRQ